VRLSLVPRERRFYDLFRRQGQLVSESLTELSKSLLEGRSRHPRLRDLEHLCDEVTHDIYHLVNRTFVAPIEQEDILLLASTLDDIVDLAEEAADKLDLYRVRDITEEAKCIGECLGAAGVELARATENLESFADLEPRLVEIHRLENESDRINREALARLFSDDATPATHLVKWKDLYDLLEETMDTCEHAANVIETISIKNA
jgi:predicted phosphate transport protein (TIGR00153 family)